MAHLARRSCELLDIHIYDTEQAMGEAAGLCAAVALRELLDSREEVNILFAAAPSQRVFLDTLTDQRGIDWSRVNGFHVDEYVGMNSTETRALARFLTDGYFNRIGLKNLFLLDGRVADVQTERRRYEELLQAHPADLAFLGIGDNGHLAFNDPPADFSNPEDVSLVTIDNVSRQQQVNAGIFPALEAVPSSAFSITIPALMRARRIFCVAPTAAKAAAVGRAVKGPLSPMCPASILRRHRSVALYLDRDSGAELL